MLRSLEICPWLLDVGLFQGVGRLFACADPRQAKSVEYAVLTIVYRVKHLIL